MKQMRTWLSSRIMGLTVVCLLSGIRGYAQHLEVSETRKKSDVAGYAIVVVKSDFEQLNVISASSDTLYKKAGSDGEHVWTQYVRLSETQDPETQLMRHPEFILSTPYTKDMMLSVPTDSRELAQGVYEYNVSVIDYFPFRIGAEFDFFGMGEYFGMRIFAGKRFGVFLSFRKGMYDRKGFDGDCLPQEVSTNKKTYVGRIRQSCVAGIRYGVSSRDIPVYVYWGIGRGEDGIQRTNGKKKPERISYYTGYTRGWESEAGVSFLFLDCVSVSVGADAIFGDRISMDFNLSIGFAFEP